MCGICGLVTKGSISAKLLKQMSDKISYRGPDDWGYEIFKYDKYNIGFAHRRLAILDLSKDGHQPMNSFDNKISVVYNGEIYNFLEIRDELEKDGYVFKSKCDTEIILYAYQKWGVSFVNKLNGMYAIALYDKETQEVILFRDRMGIKPCYYFLNDEGDFAFASELKPLMEIPFFRKEIDMEAVNMYLAHQYIAAPKCIFKDTYKLEAGSFLIYKKGVVKKQHYWDIKQVFDCRNIQTDGMEEHTKMLEKLIIDSVKKRIIADVPVGAFLSGGIDSSLIATIAQEQMTRPLDTFTIGFKEEEYNEAMFAKEIAKIIGSNHHEEYCSERQMVQLIRDIPKYFDEPFADNSQIPTMLVSKMARNNVTVALSGDGGDELFCGYTIYKQLLLYKKTYWIAKLLNPIIKINNCGDKRTWRLSKLLGCINDEDTAIIDYIKTNELLKNILKVQPGIYEKYLTGINIKSQNIQEKRMILDLQTYLPEDILAKVDRASMRYSLEARVPLLDYRIVSYSFNIPHKYKYEKSNSKIILKEILSRHLPSQLFDRPKTGFGMPLIKWLDNDLKTLIEYYLAEDYLEKQGIFNVCGITELLYYYNKYRTSVLVNLVWSLLIFQLWYEEYME